jgi:hypothetical protein
MVSLKIFKLKSKGKEIPVPRLEYGPRLETKIKQEVKVVKNRLSNFARIDRVQIGFEILFI